MKRSAIIGSAVWIGLYAANQFRIARIDLTWIELLFMFAPLVIVPLGLELSKRSDAVSVNRTVERIVGAIQLPAALITIASFFLERGASAVALASGWVAFCGVLAISGLLRLARGARRSLADSCIAVGFLYPSIGAAWLIASRVGLTPIGFEEPIVLLTAVHFHYAGFAAPILASCTSRVRATRRSKTRERLFQIVAAGVLAGPAVLAAGFVISPRLKLAAALSLAAAEIGLAVFFLIALRSVDSQVARTLLLVAAGSVIVSMILAALWAIGEYPLQPFVHLANMARFHGTANAFGFTLCGLLGFLAASNRAGAQRSSRT
jgi:hypothetical protein